MAKGTISETAVYAIKNPSSIREIMSLVTDFKKHPEKYPRPLIYLGGGWPQDPPPPVLKEVAKEVVEDDNTWIESSRYGTTRGQPDFINGIVNYEKYVFNRKILEEEVIVGSGSTELTAAFMLSILDPGTEVIITRPGYLNYPRQVQIETLLRCKIKRWTILRNHEFNPDFDELQEMISDKTRMLIICTPGNPDGQIYTDDMLNAINDIAEEKGIWVMVDVAYRTFIYEKPPSYFSRERSENEIWMCTLSKEFRIPGWRMAYAVADKELISAVETVEQARILCPNKMAQEILTRVLQDNKKLKSVKEYYEKGRDKYKKVAQYTTEELRNNIPDLGILEPRGGFYVFFDASKYEKSSKKLCNDLLKECQVALAPGIDFGMEGWLRLSFAPIVEEPETLKEGLNRMKEYFSKRK